MEKESVILSIVSKREKRKRDWARKRRGKKCIENKRNLRRKQNVCQREREKRRNKDKFRKGERMTMWNRWRKGRMYMEERKREDKQTRVGRLYIRRGSGNEESEVMNQMRRKKNDNMSVVLMMWRILGTWKRSRKSRKIRGGELLSWQADLQEESPSERKKKKKSNTWRNKKKKKKKSPT